METETQTQTLAEFLLARIAEDEGYAPKYHSSMCEWMMRQDVDDLAECDCGLDARRTFHLAECEAKRRIVEDCAEMIGYTEKSSAPILAAGILLALAHPYADHPDFREEWKP